MKIRGLVYSSVIAIVLVGSLSATIIRVPQDQPTIQAGIHSAVEGDTVLVDTGRYVENIHFNGKNIVVGSLFLTTGDTSHISQTVIDGDSSGGVVTFGSGEDSSTVLCGFTITNGGGECNLEFCEGGGIMIRESSPRLMNLIILNNSALGSDVWYGKGGGIYCLGSNPKLVNVELRRNTTDGYGGGMYCSDSSPTFVNVTVTGNRAGLKGGGIFFHRSDPRFDHENRCNVYYNWSLFGRGGDLYASDSPTIAVLVDTFTVMNPTDYHAYPIDNFTFDILHAKVEPVDSDLYVSPEGHNTNSGLSPSEPLRSISVALLKILADSLNPRKIYLSEGKYSPSITGEHLPLSMVSYVSLSGKSKDSVILDGEGVSNVLLFHRDTMITIENLTITGGSAPKGGGIYCSQSSPKLVDVTVRRNKAKWEGGGIYLEDNSNPTLESVKTSRNMAHIGGGIYCGNGSRPYLANVTVSKNMASWGGGGIFLSRSGLNFDSQNRCNIYSNQARSGSDLYAYNSPTTAVVVDTFTVMIPTEYYAKPIDDFTFNILHAKVEQVEGNVYVSPQGNDMNSGQSQLEPLQTITFALSKILADSLNPRTIHLSEGIYSPSTTGEVFPIDMVSYVSLSGASETNVILDAEGLGTVMVFNQDHGIKVDNLTVTGGGSDYGGGIYCSHSSSPTLIDITVKGNSGYHGGGISCYGGSSPRLESVTVAGNTASYGAGIYCSHSSSPTLVNVLVSMNTASKYGGGIYCFNNSAPILNSVTLSGNLASKCGGGIYLGNGSSPSLLNTILWNDYPNEICVYDHVYQTGSNSITIAYSDVQGDEEGIVAGDNDTVNWLEGNIDSDPLFVDPENADFSLSEGSPCIDAGTALFVWESDTLVNLPDTAFEGNAPDMGTFESPYSVAINGEMMLPTQFALSQPYPNPFNPSTTIDFSMPSSAIVTLTVYDVLGGEVKTILKQHMDAGQYEVQWNPTNVRSGVYFIRMQSGDFSQVRKVTVLK